MGSWFKYKKEDMSKWSSGEYYVGLCYLFGKGGRNIHESSYIPSSKNRERIESLCGTNCSAKKISISKCEEIHLA